MIIQPKVSGGVITYEDSPLVCSINSLFTLSIHSLPQTTQVQSLTIQPKVSEGVITYEDSPLVRAVRSGHVLVVDEADKAPTNVTCVLKTLVESGTMTLGDGRRIMPASYAAAKEKADDVIVTHPHFRMMVRTDLRGG